MIKIGDRIAQLRKQKGWSQSELAKRISATREAIGKYERNEALPSAETAKKIADAFEVTLDYLVGEGVNVDFDQRTLERIKDLSQLEEDKKKTLFDLIDTYIRDAKARRAYAS